MVLNSPLVSNKIFLRSLSKSDANANYLNWFLDPDVCRYLEVRFSPPKSNGQLADFIKDANNSADTLLLGIFLQENQRHIGNIKLGSIKWHHHHGEIGLLIGDRTEWGKGFASNAIALLTDYAFFNLNLIKITAGCCSDNIGSLNAFIRNNYTQEGRRISQWLMDGNLQDDILLGKLNPSWKIKSPTN